jgi:NTE family protein
MEVSLGELRLIKRVLYFAPQPEALATLLGEFERLTPAAVELEASPPVVTVEGVAAQMFACSTAESALARLGSEYFNLVLVDFRGPTGPMRGLGFLDALERETELETRFAFHRIVALVPAGPLEAVDRLIAELGSRGVGRIIRESEPGAVPVERLASALVELVTSKHEGGRALCISGGGIAGLYYEMAVLKCLDDCCSGNAVNSFDMYFGISAGAVISGLLAVGFSVDEVMASIAGHPGGRLPPMDLNVLRLRHLNWRDLLRRLRATGGDLLRWVPRFVKGESRLSLASVFFDYFDVLGPLFRTDAYEEMLRDIMQLPGATNDFRELSRRLFLGATDQDTRKHVLFGAEGQDGLPISRAIQASMSLNPAFASTLIGGRYYEDGAVTHTSNFVEAIRRGADLLFVLDPLVPYLSREPGYASRRGVLYNVDQDIRSMSFSRFSNTRQWVLRQHPEVSLYTFLPGNELRYELSSNPLDHRHFLRIWRGAYVSTLQRVLLLQHRLRGDLRRHGIELRTSRAEAVAARLKVSETPTFADFFPDRRVVLRQPTLAREPRSSGEWFDQSLNGKIVELSGGAA